MRAVSVPQPWASLLAHGVLRLETRSWQTPYRGVLAIHAGLRFPPVARGLCHREPFRTLLRRANHEGWSLLPCGCVLGTAKLVACTRVEEFMWEQQTEPHLADFRSGRWVWEYADPVLFHVPVRATGRLGVFEVRDALLAQGMVTT